MQARMLKVSQVLLMICALLIVFSITTYPQDDRHEGHHDHGRHEGWSKHEDNHRHDEGYYGERRDHRGEHKWDRRDEDYREVRFDDRDYYFHHGEFYERRPEGYVVINAPIGLNITYLPQGYRVVRHRGIRFYFFGGIYYRYNPTSRFYFVVKAPF